MTVSFVAEGISSEIVLDFRWRIFSLLYFVFLFILMR